MPKAPHKGGPKKQFPTKGKSLGRAATGIKHSTRSRLGKLAAQPIAEIKAAAASWQKWISRAGEIHWPRRHRSREAGAGRQPANDPAIIA